MVPTIFNTTAIVSDAQKSRGYYPSGGGLIKRIKRYTPLIVPVLLYTIRNATRISIALESKGFMRKNKRTDYIEYTFRFIDILLLSILIIIVTSGIILRVNGYGEIIDRI
jgi:energy-coupling factor transport system permease protein